jgi:hypothetical protein
MGFFGRLTSLGKGMWKTKARTEPEFTEALERELKHVASEQEKERARARLALLKGEEPEPSEVDVDPKEEESEPLSRDNPPKKTL